MHVHLEVGAARDVGQSGDFRARERTAAEAVDVGGTYIDHRFQVATEPAVVDLDGEAADDAGAHEPANSIGGGVGGEVHPIAEGLVGNAGVVAENGEDFAVDTVQS